MNLTMSDKVRNRIFYILLCSALIYGFVFSVLGNDQNKEFMTDYQQYQNAVSLVNQQKFAEASPLLKSVVEKYPTSFVALWQYAICLDGLGDYQGAKDYYMKVQKKRPFILVNQYYLIQMGKVLYREGDLKEAKKYFLAAKKVNENPDLTNVAEQLLKELATHEKAK